MRQGIKLTAAICLILFPIVVYGLYAIRAHRPMQVRIGAGRIGGQYHLIARALKSRIERDQPHVRCRLIETEGALENLFLLEAGQIELALYQPGAFEALYDHDRQTLSSLAQNVQQGIDSAKTSVPPEYKALCRQLTRSTDDTAPPLENVRFVANLYHQPAHLVVRPGAVVGADNLRQSLEGKTVAIGVSPSGDYAMSLVLLSHLGLRPPDVTIHAYDQETLGEQTYYDAVAEQLHRDNMAPAFDAALVTVGQRAGFFKKLAERCRYDIVGLPNVEALVRNHFYLSSYTIPAGMYGTAPHERPRTPAHTVAAGAQLLTRQDADADAVEHVTRIVVDRNFAKKNHLRELFTAGRSFAAAQPDFTIHPGAQSVYDPDFDIHVVESVEAVYSLAVSLVIASFFGLRWLKRKRVRASEHKLDRFIRSLLEIERQQMPLDASSKVDHQQQLQRLLDEVTLLRQRALGEFTAHDLNEDRGSDCFINMCHALSSKINAKLSRQRLEAAFGGLANTVRDAGEGQALESGRHIGNAT